MSGPGAAIGAATGATYALATGKDPIKYAMIGGAVGGAGPAALSALGPAAAGASGAGAAGAGAAAGTGAAAGAGAAGTYTGLGMAGTGAAGTTSALTGAGASTAATTMPGAVGAFGQAVPAIPPAAPGIFATPAQVSAFQPLTYEQATAAGMQRPYGTFESLLNPNIESSSMAPTFMEQLGSGASQVGQFAQQNPVLVGMAAQSAQQMMQQPQRRSQPPGLLRGNQMQASAPQYQVGVPQVSLI